MRSSPLKKATFHECISLIDGSRGARRAPRATGRLFRCRPPAMANAIRALAMDAVEQAKSGHPGMPMGMADVATVCSRGS